MIRRPVPSSSETSTAIAFEAVGRPTTRGADFRRHIEAESGGAAAAAYFDGMLAGLKIVQNDFAIFEVLGLIVIKVVSARDKIGIEAERWVRGHGRGRCGCRG